MKDYIESPNVLRVEANVDGKAWHRLTNTYGFYEQINAQPSGLRLQAALHAWPNRIGVATKEFPEGATAHFRHIANPELPLISYSLDHGQIILCINVSHCKSAKLPTSGRAGFYFKPKKIWGRGRLGLWLSVLGYFPDVNGRKYPDILEFDTQFYSGGLPGHARGH